MIKKAAVGLGALVGLFLIIVATRPAEYRVVRSVVVNAPAAVISGHIEDFHRWNAWSPWAKLDPKQKETFGGPPAGKDATYHWSGDDKVGEGSMKIAAVKPGERIDIALEFIRPFPSSSKVDFVLVPQGAGTQVSWGMDGTNNFLGKAFGLFVNMDKMLGADFEKGLAQLKAAAEAEAAHASAQAAKAAEPAATP
ncbi:MAG: SRPBCC family protein [Deltaproteobacteria bacterium]|nr:SRPBCC family protein [Deltaproteobacteria bacterium]